jgi:hypothetical protein
MGAANFMSLFEAIILVPPCNKSKTLTMPVSCKKLSAPRQRQDSAKVLESIHLFESQDGLTMNFRTNKCIINLAG